MQIHPIKALSDNYIWVMEEGTDAAVVDPGESQGVLEYLEKEQKTLQGILLTHEHADHVGGVEDILAASPNTPVYGPSETAEYASTIVKEGDTVELLGLTFEVLKTAGHSKEHISFLSGDSLFCGDALFSGGCGRVFTGDYQAQYDALQQFAKLNGTVAVYAGHEYTETNLRFAQSVEPDNEKIAEALKEAQEKRENDQPTLPSTIEKEKNINLLMEAENLERFIELRKARDEF